MKLPHLAAAGLLASLGYAQAQPAAETPGISRDAAQPTIPARPGTNTPAGVIQGVVPPTGQGSVGAAQGTVPIAPSPGVPPQGEVVAPGTPAQTGLAAGDRARDALGMGAGRPATSMPPGSIAGQAPGMGATPQGTAGQGAMAPRTATPGAATPGAAAPGTMTPGTTTPGVRPGTATTGTTAPGTATPGTATPGTTTPGAATPGAGTTSGGTTPGATPPAR